MGAQAKVVGVGLMMTNNRSGMKETIADRTAIAVLSTTRIRRESLSVARTIAMQFLKKSTAVLELEKMAIPVTADVADLVNRAGLTVTVVPLSSHMLTTKAYVAAFLRIQIRFTFVRRAKDRREMSGRTTGLLTTVNHKTKKSQCMKLMTFCCNISSSKMFLF